FEGLTFVQTGKVSCLPMVLFGSDYWQGLIDWMTTTLLAEGTISDKDLNLFTLTDDIDEVVDIIGTAIKGEQQ
ncbi:MAG: LOG family protein, partial [Brevibacterium aurantiacum]|nr:LOG family protein [Brevibacterium aurantiacum]